MRQFPERRDLPLRQSPHLPCFQPLIPNRTDAHPPQAHDLVAHDLAHVPHLTVPSFAQGDRQDRLVAALQLGRETQIGRRRAASLEPHAPAQAIDRAIVGHASHAHFVLALDAVSRMRQPRGEVSVVRDEDETLRVEVQPADRIEIPANLLLRQEVHDGRPPLRIGARAHVAARLVQQEVVPRRLGANAPPVDTDLVAAGIRFGTQLRDGLAVDGDAPLNDQGFSDAPRGDTGGGQELLETYS